MKYILFFVIFLLPIFARAEVIISEISWMGDSSSANAEWIEIHNNGSVSVNLSGWTLKAEDGSPSINLSGSISSGSYEALERTSDSTVQGVTALVIYSGALANDGEHLVLRDGNGNIIQNLDFSGGWTAGDNTSKETMQWNGSIWITASPTPGAQNASFDSGSGGGQGTGGEEEDDEENENEEEDGEDEEESSTSSSLSSKKPTTTYAKKIVDIKVVDSSVPVGSPVIFTLDTRDLKGANISKGDFFWNMGDGTERFFNKNERFEHTYDHEGTYTVFLKYYSTYFEGMDPEVTDKIVITVGSPNIEINKIHLDGSIEIKNISSQEIDLSNWSLKDNFGKVFLIPEETYVSAGKNLVLNSKRTKLNPTSVYLFTPSGGFASFKEKFPSTSQVINSFSGSSSSASSGASSRSSNYSLNDSNEDIEEGSVNLNDRFSQNIDSRDKQKEPPLWVILFVLMIVGVSILVFFIYKKKEEKNKEITEEDDFELID